MQLDLVYAHGVSLSRINRYNFCLDLFQFEGFYVEVFSREGDGEVFNLRAFEDLNDLDPYLEQIIIADVVEYLYK